MRKLKTTNTNHQVCISVDIVKSGNSADLTSQVLPEMWQEVASYIGPKEGDPFAGRVMEKSLGFQGSNL